MEWMVSEESDTGVIDTCITFLMKPLPYTDVGRPLTPLSHLVQTAETIHSITLDWGIPHTITHYTILLVEPLEIEQEIKSVLHSGP